MSTSDPPDSSPPGADGSDSIRPPTVDRLVRLHNLLILVVFAAGLGSLAVAQSRGSLIERGSLYYTLIVVRIAVPLTFLALTAIVTNRALTGHARRRGGTPVTVESVLPTFRRCKRLSLVLLAAAGLFAAGCLIVTSRTIDLALAGLTFVLLVFNRPSVEAAEHLAAIAEATRQEILGDASQVANQDSRGGTSDR